MKFRKILSILLIISVAFVPLSCNDSFLELQPATSISKDMALVTIDDVETAMYGVYDGWRGMSGALIIIPDIICDDFFPVIGYTNAYGQIIAWDYGADDMGYVFGGAYNNIVQASNIINKLDEGLISDEYKDRKNVVLGTCLLSRAMSHFELVRAYSKRYDKATAASDLGVPIVREQTITFPTRNTVQEVYDFIFEDIDRVINKEEDGSESNLLPSIANNGNTEFSMNLLYAFLSRVYLEMGDYQNVIKYSSLVIDGGSYNLVDNKYDLEDLWEYDGEGGGKGDGSSEIIFKAAITITNGGPAIGATWNTGQIGNDPRPDYVASPALLDMYDKKDYRYDAYFMDNVTTPRAGRQTILNKYPTNPNLNILNVNQAKLYRIAEQYLNRAEAYEALGNTASAQADLDAILSARNATAYGTGLKEQIRNERRKELVAEGFRFFDLRRWGTGFTRVTNEGCIKGCNLEVRASDHRWLMPIPVSEMTSNENMVQNPGYVK